MRRRLPAAAIGFGLAWLVTVSPLAAQPAAFYTVPPCRLLDTRAGAPLTDGVGRIVPVGGSCGVAADATAVVLNVTSVGATGPGFLTVSAGGTMLGTSTLNFGPGQTRANIAVVRLSPAGLLGLLPFVAGSGSVHIIIDVSGYFVVDIPPVGQDDTAAVAEDAVDTTIDVLGNDTDADGGLKRVASVTQPANGTVAVTNGGADLTYRPNPDYCNAPPGSTPDTFTYALAPAPSSAVVSVTVNCVNDAPVVAGTGVATFTEGAGPVAIAPAVTVTDVDGATLASASVTITNLLNAGVETLAATTAGTAIIATYVAPTLSLAGVDSLANYETVLRSVTYDNTSTNPDPSPRSVAFVASDGSNPSAPSLALVSVVTSNDPPVLTSGGGSPAFTEDDPPVAVDPGLVATDPDDANLESATVTITNLADLGVEVLAASTAGTAITATYLAPVLSLSGSDTVANYQAVLRSVTYANSSQDPSPGPRSVAFQANDGTVGSNVVTVAVGIVAVNDPPVATAGGASPTFTEDGPAVVVDPGFLVTDVDDTTLATATVIMLNLPDGGAETLSANTAGTAIVAAYAAPVLTLTGTDTLANYQAVLRGVTYANSSQNPTTVNRILSFTANDGTASSNPAATTLSLVAVNDAPVLTAGGGSPAFAENGPPVVVDPALAVADVDNANLATATVTIGNLLDAGAETLAASTAGTSILAVYAAPTLTLTGSDTVAAYQAVLRSVTYANSSDSPSSTARSLSFVVNDGALASNAAVKAVAVNAVADAPVLTAGGGASPVFTEDGPPVTIDPGLSVTDVDSTTLASATVTVTNLLDVGAEALVASTVGTAIVANYAAPVLTLTGADTLANYQAVLRGVSYSNTSQNPNPASRNLAFSAHDGAAASNVVVVTVGITPVNDVPVLAGAGTVTFTEDAGPVVVAPALTVADADNANLTAAAVAIGNLLNPGSEFLAATTTGTSIIASYAAPTLSLTGIDTVANYQAVLRSVTYINLSSAPTTLDRLVGFVAGDGTGGSNQAVATVQVVAVNDPLTLTNNPVAYATPGNTQLHVGGATLAGVASVSDPATALAKAVPVDIDGPLPPAVIAASGATTGGGTFSIAADGAFTYVPAAGFTGTDSFPYQVTDSTASVTGTVNIAVSSVVWYVRDVVDANNPAAGDGRSTNAFETLGAAEAASAANHYLFVFAGNTATTPLSTGIVLKDGQKLHGEGVGLSVPGFPGIVAAGPEPRLNNASGDAVSVPATAGNRNGVEVRGLDLQAVGNAVDVTSSGTNIVGVTVSNNTIRGATLEGLDLNAGSSGLFTAVVQNNAITSAGTAIDARTTAGAALRIAASGNNVTSSAGSGIVIDGSAGGAIVVNGLGGNLVSGNTAGLGISVTTATLDAVNGGALDPVPGGITAIGAVGNGVGGAGLILAGVAGAILFDDLDIVADGGVGLRLQGTGPFNGTTGTQLTVPAGSGTIRAIGGPGVDVTGATVDLRLGLLTSANSPTTGISLVNVSDGAAVAALFSAPVASSITNAGGTDVNVSGGNGGVVYAGPIANSAGRSVSIVNWSGDDIGDDIVFSGAITDTAQGILVNGNAGNRSITFSGGLSLNPASLSVGLLATNNTNTGGLQVTGATNTVATTAAAALNVSNTTIGTGGLTFQRVSASGPTANGIMLLNTGTQGGLTVTGTGAAASGGVIQNMTGDGISLVNTRAVSLSRMSITTNLGSGIGGDDVTNFTLAESTVTNNGDTATGVEAGIRFQELLGTCSISNTVVSGSSEDNIRITPASGVLTSLAISGSTIGPNSAATGGNGVTILGTGSATGTVSVTGTTFTGNRGAAFVSNFASTGSHNLTVGSSVFRDNGKAVSLASNGSTDLTFSVTNNSEIVRSVGNALELLASSDASSAMEVRGTFSGNIMGNGAADSGSRDWYGLAIDLRGDERSILAVNNNNIRNVDFSGIFLQDADFGVLAGPVSEADLTVRDNSVQNIDDNSGFPCGAPYGVLVDVRHTTQACLDMFSNTSAESPAACGAAHFRLRQRDTSTFQLERLSDGDGTPNELINSVATVQAHVVGQNDLGSTANATLTTGFTEAATGTCAKP